jgi:enoyl-CoA hydratase/carnithine racemase
MTEYMHFRIDESLVDRVMVWIDVEGRSVNAFSEPVLDELLQIVEQQQRRNRILPLVFRSAKHHSFVVGADLRRILAIETDVEVQQFMLHGQAAFERLEQFRGTTLAIINGPWIGIRTCMYVSDSGQHAKHPIGYAGVKLGINARLGRDPTRD